MLQQGRHELLFVGKCLALLAILLVMGWIVLATQQGSSARLRPNDAQEVSASDWQTRLVQRGLNEMQSKAVRDLPPLSTGMQTESMPRKLRTAVSEMLGGNASLRLKFAQSQHLVAGGRWGISIVEGRGVVCMVRDSTATVACNTAGNARRRGMVLEVYRPSTSLRSAQTRFLALGAVPAWVAAVRLRVAGVARREAVLGRSFAVRAKAPIEVIGLLRKQKKDVRAQG